MSASTRYHTTLAACYCRGALQLPLDTSDETAIDAGIAAKLSHLYRFKRNDNALLPRVKEIIGVVQSFGVCNILDVASQRGALLWPLLDNLDGGAATVTSIDMDEEVVAFLSTVVDGGGPFQVQQADVTSLPFADEQFDCVIASEILEHLTDPSSAASELLRVTSNVVICTVPAQPDDNPEHIQLFYDKRGHDETRITRKVQQENQIDLIKLWQTAGASSVKVRLVHDGPISVLLAIVMK